MLDCEKVICLVHGIQDELRSARYARAEQAIPPPIPQPKERIALIRMMLADIEYEVDHLRRELPIEIFVDA